MEFIADDNVFLKLLCLIIVVGFVLVAVIRSFRGDKDLEV